MDVMIRNSSMQPTSALPVTRNMPYYSASVPTRNQPRNMTGIYLGLEGNVKPPNNRGTPGLNSSRMRKGVSQKNRTPTEDRRYRMVELLRIKEDKRGFKGQILKVSGELVPLRTLTQENSYLNLKDMSSTEDSYPGYEFSGELVPHKIDIKKRDSQESFDQENLVPNVSNKEQLKFRKWGPAKSANPQRFEDVIRQNPRNYTNIVNSGVTRSENLTGIMSFADHYGWDITNVPITDALVEEVTRIAKEREDLAGLEECFRKVCKGNVESMQSLLPLRKSSARSENYETGFTVRSYRNPNRAQLLANFESAPSTIPSSRPKTVPARSMHDPRQPHVPAPYFFKYYNKPLTSNTHTHKKTNSPITQYEDVPTPVNSERIFGLPGNGSISRNLKPDLRTGRSTAWSEGDPIRIRKSPEYHYKWNPILGCRRCQPVPVVLPKPAYSVIHMGPAPQIHGTPRTESPVKETDRLAQNTPRHDSTLSSLSAQPLEIRAEGYPINNNNPDDKSSLSDRNTEPPYTGRTESSTTRSGEGTNKSVNRQTKHASPLQGTSSNMDGRIRLDLETEDGKKQQIILDDKDDSQIDETERVKASEAKVASMKEVAKQRKKEFEQILDEHAEIVTRITRQASNESNNETFQSAENERDQ